MSKVGVTDPRQKVYELFLEGLIQAEVARARDVSEEAIRKIKVKLIEAGYLQGIPGTNLYERGPNAKYFEKAVKIRKKITEATTAENGEDEDAQPSNTPAVRTSQKASRPQPVRVEEYDIGDLEAHMHGYMIFDVESLGHTDYIEVTREGVLIAKVPLFTTGDNLNYHNNHRWDCDLRLPGKEWQVHLQLRKTPTKTLLSIYPPRVAVLEEDCEENKEHPGNIFQREVYEVLDFLEKHGRWRFVRGKGNTRDGRMAGQVYYALRDEELAKHIPSNLAGYEDGKGMHIDRSKGIPEIEANKDRVDDILFLLRAKDAHQQVEEEIKALRQENMERERRYEIERGENLDRFIQLEKEQGKMLDFQLRELKRKEYDDRASRSSSSDRMDEISTGRMYG